MDWASSDFFCQYSGLDCLVGYQDSSLSNNHLVTCPVSLWNRPLHYIACSTSQLWEDILTSMIFWSRGRNIIMIYWLLPLTMFWPPINNQWQSFICISYLLEKMHYYIKIILMISWGFLMLFALPTCDFIKLWIVLLAVNWSRTPVTTSSYFGKPPPPEWITQGDRSTHLVLRITMDLEVSAAVHSLARVAPGHFP